MARLRADTDLWTITMATGPGHSVHRAASYGNHGDPAANGGRDIHRGNLEFSKGEGVTQRQQLYHWYPTPRKSLGACWLL